MTRTELYIKLLNKFGEEKQMLKCVEELNELAQAICKYMSPCFRDSSKHEEKGIENIIEEISDVEIMIEQLKFILNINDDDVRKMKNYKLHRTAERLGLNENGGVNND